MSDFFDDIFSLASRLPPGVRDPIASEIQPLYLKVYRNLFPSDPELENYEKFYEGKTPWHRELEEAHKRVGQTTVNALPTDYSSYAHGIDPKSVSPEMLSRFNRGQTGIRGAQTVADLQKAILSSMYVDIGNIAERGARKGADPFEAFNDTYVQIQNRFATFSPTYTDNQGRTFNSNFAVHALTSALTGRRDAFRGEIRQNTTDIPMVEPNVAGSRISQIRPGYYQLHGLFSRQGQLFAGSDPTNMTLRALSMEPDKRLRPVIMGPQDLRRIQIYQAFGPQQLTSSVSGGLLMDYLQGESILYDRPGDRVHLLPGQGKVGTGPHLDPFTVDAGEWMAQYRSMEAEGLSNFDFDPNSLIQSVRLVNRTGAARLDTGAWVEGQIPAPLNFRGIYGPGVPEDYGHRPTVNDPYGSRFAARPPQPSAWNPHQQQHYLLSPPRFDTYPRTMAGQLRWEQQQRNLAVSGISDQLEYDPEGSAIVRQWYAKGNVKGWFRNQVDFDREGIQGQVNRYRFITPEHQANLDNMAANMGFVEPSIPAPESPPIAGASSGTAAPPPPVPPPMWDTQSQQQVSGRSRIDMPQSNAVAFGTRVLSGVSVPSSGPPVLSERQAFMKSQGRGRSRLGNYAYLRDPVGDEYVPEEEYLATHSGREMLQKTWKMEKAAGLHELGHQIWDRLPGEAREKFRAIFNAKLADVGKEGMLSADWFREHDPKKTGKPLPNMAGEEFAQTYAAAGSFGGEVLEYGEYAEYMLDHEEMITKAEGQATLISRVGGLEQAFQAKVLEEEYPVTGEIPAMPGNQTPRQWQTKSLRRYMDIVGRSGTLGRLRQEIQAAAQAGTLRVGDDAGSLHGIQFRAYQEAGHMLGYDVGKFNRIQGSQQWEAKIQTHQAAQQAQQQAARQPFINHAAQQQTPPPPPNFNPGSSTTPARNQSTQQSPPPPTNFGAGQYPTVNQPISARFSAVANPGPQSPLPAITPADRQYALAQQVGNIRATGGQGYIVSNRSPIDQATFDADPNTGELAFRDRQGRTVFGGAQINAAANVAAGALQTASSGPLPTRSRDTFATVIQRFDKAIKEYYDDTLKKASPDQRATIEMEKRVARAIGRRGITQARGATGEAVPHDEMSDLARAYAGKTQITAGNLDQIYGADAGLRANYTRDQLQSYIQSGQQFAITGGAGGNYGIGFGGGGGGRDQPPNRLSLWGGKAGGMMYAAYIARRMWTMTAAPQFMASQEYAKEMGSIAGLQTMMTAQQYGAPARLTSTDAGAEARQMATQRWMQRGAYQQWGGLSDVGYMMSGYGEGLPRVASGLAVAGGAAIAGSIVGQTLGFLGGIPSLGAMGSALGGIGAAAPYLGLGIAAVGAVGTLGMEAYNFFARPEEEATWGSTARNVGRDYAYLRASYAQGGWSGLFNAPSQPGGALPTMTPEEQAMWEYGNEPAVTKAMREQLQAVEEATGEKVSETQSAFRGLTRGLGGIAPRGMAQLATDWASIGLSVSEGAQSFVNYADQMGYRQGTAAYRGAWSEYRRLTSQGDIAAYEGYMSRGKRVAQFGGQIAPYFANQRQAYRLTDEYDLTTSARMKPVQSLLGVGTEFGVDADTIAGYTYDTSTSAPRGVSVAEAFMQQAERRGTFLSTHVDTPAMSSMMSAGVPFQFSNVGQGMSPLQVQQMGNWLQISQAYGSGYGSQALDIRQAVTSVSPYQASLIPKVAPSLMQYGYSNVMPTLAAGMGQNLSDYWAGVVGQGMGGDMKAMSYMAQSRPELFKNANQWRLYNEAGQPIHKTDFGAFLNLGEARSNLALVNQNAFAGASGMSVMDATRQFFQETMTEKTGVELNEGYVNAFATGGSQGAMWYHRAQQASFRKQSAGIAMAGVALSRQYLWGGGQWDGSPAEGSIWWYQDKLRALGNRQQLSNFAYSQEAMETRNEFAVRQEDITQSRMAVSAHYQRDQSAFQYGGMMLQRGWARQDWAYQDQMRDLSFGWQMEDFDEAIRTSSGRQRSQLVKRKERAVTKQNLEGEQIDETRSRQEELWAREDERFERSRAYQEEMIELEEEQFQLQQEQRTTMFQMESEHLSEQVKFYKERYKLEGELQAVQREFQAKQLDLQAAAAAVQAAAAEDSEQYSLAMAATAEQYENIEGSVAQMSKYDPVTIFESFSAMVIDMDRLSQAKVDDIGDMFERMNQVNWNNLSGLTTLFNTIGGLNTFHISRLISLLNSLEDE